MEFDLVATREPLPLRQLAPALVRASNALVSSGRISVISLGGVPWRVRVEGLSRWRRAALDLTLRVNGQRCRVRLADLGMDALAQVPWAQLDSSMRLLYAESCCDELINTLAARCGLNVVLESVDCDVTDDVNRDLETGIALALREGAATSTQARFLRVLVVFEDASARGAQSARGAEAIDAIVAALGRWTRVAPPISSPPSSSLPIRLWLTLGSVAITRSALDEIATGDVICTDTYGTLERWPEHVVARLGQHDVCTLTIDRERRCTVKAVDLSDQHRDRRTAPLTAPVSPIEGAHPMSSPETPSMPLASLSDIELTTTFAIGGVSITLETLRTLRPGYTFTTTIATDSPMVSILVEGQRAGLGRLVAVGDRIGVQVTHWSTAGSTAGSNESTAATMPIVLEPATHG